MYRPEGSAGRWLCDWCSLRIGCVGDPAGGPRSPSSPPPPRSCGCSGRRCWWGGTGSGQWSTGRSHQMSSCRRAAGKEERREQREWIPTRGKSLKEEDLEQVQKQRKQNQEQSKWLGCTELRKNEPKVWVPRASEEELHHFIWHDEDNLLNLISNLTSFFSDTCNKATK